MPLEQTMSDLNYITCTKCGEQIPINEALSHQIEERFRKEIDAKTKEIETERQKLKEQSAKAAEELELKLKQKEQELTEKSRQFLLEQKEKLKEEIAKEAQEKVILELEDLKKQNLEKEMRIKEAQALELKLRQERREIEEKQKNFELEMMRKLDEEKQKLSIKLQEDLGEKHKIQQMEYEKKLGDMQKALEDAQRKALASSERFRGEVQELSLESSLKSNFIFDTISEVPKGILGADVIQNVRDEFGQDCGVIIWESKRTKAFNEDWIVKLKDDLIRSKGKHAVLVSQSLPDDIKGCFEFRNGVWICDFETFLELAMVLRFNLIELRRLEKINEGKGEKMSIIYNYLSSDEFRNKIVSITETFKMMQEQLEQEKRAFQKQWAAREMQIKRMMEGTVSIIGDLQGIMGSSLPQIDGMDMPGLGF